MKNLFSIMLNLQTMKLFTYSTISNWVFKKWTDIQEASG